MNVNSSSSSGLLEQKPGRLESLIFDNRLWVLLGALLISVLLAIAAVSKLTLNASFEKMIPQGHPFIKNYLANKSELRGLGNSLRIVVSNPKGDIFTPEYIKTLKAINDEVFLTDGVDRAWIRSLWSPAVRWTEITEEGFRGGPVMPDQYDGSEASVSQLKANIAKAGLMGSLVGKDLKSSMLLVPLLDFDPATGKRLDYTELSAKLEALRAQYETPESGLKIHITGFAKLVGDLIDGLYQVALYFGAAALIAVCILMLYTRCLRSTTMVIACSLVAVVWQLGLISLLGYELDPYSILVPFLVFAIGVSHGAQKMNGIMSDIANGMSKVMAARLTFRRLFLAGLTALLADVVGFAVLMVIDIPVIQELALSASLGVSVLIVTNLIVLPVLLSYVGVKVSLKPTSKAVDSPVNLPGSAGGVAPQSATQQGPVFSTLAKFTTPAWAYPTLFVALLMMVGGFVISTHLQIGDRDAGAPELRADSRYNKDGNFINSKYSLSSDTFAVMVKTAPEGCLKYSALTAADQLAWQLQQVEGVQNTVSLANAIRLITAGTNEGNPKWLTISRNQDVLNYSAQQASVNNPELFNTDCSVMPVVAYLDDHKAETLDRVTLKAEQFAKGQSNQDHEFFLAAGSAGIEAATNMVVRKAWVEMLVLVYIAVGILCFVTFRNWRAVVVAMVPLVLTSILCEALMVALGIGVKVATLPVIALGVGIGVDYALYLLSIQLAAQRKGKTLAQAYLESLHVTGKVVALVGVTLSAGVITWAFSPIKFQADMGILLAFMFIWNMVGAVVLIPALSQLVKLKP